MEKNKSIDGLATRRSKKATPTVTSTIKPQKTITKTPPVKPKTPAKQIKVVKPVKIQVQEQKPTPKTPTAPVTPATPPKPTTNITEDFLKPTQVFDFDEKSG